MSKKGLLGGYISLFFLTVSNPITIVVFMAVFAGMSVFGESASVLGELLVVVGVLLGGGVWWYTLSTLVNIFRKKFRLRVLVTINRVSGLIIAILGALVILALFSLLNRCCRCDRLLISVCKNDVNPPMHRT